MDWENQKMLETFFNARQIQPMLRQELESSETVIKTIKESPLEVEFCYDLLAQMIQHKRAHPSVLIGLLKHHFKDCANPFQACADALVQAAEKNLMDYDINREQFVIRFDVDDKTHQLMRQYQCLPPMIVPPLEVNRNRGSGYITIKDDSLLLQHNHHEGDLCLDSINRFNNVALSVNIELVKRIRNSWRNLDKPKVGESFEEFQKRTKAFERYEQDSFFTIALLAEMGNRFHLTHKVDKRGRTYCQGYHVNYQGNCWNKATIEFADKHLIED